MGLVPAGRIQFLSEEAARQHLAEWLFVETLRDLRMRSRPPHTHDDRYRILGIAPLLRKLLADGKNTLLHAVRKPPGRPTPMFMAAPFAEEAPKGDYKMMGLGLDFTGPRSLLTLDDFLALRAGHVAGEDLTVLQVIQHYSYVEGGVHLGVPTSKTSDLLLISAADPPPFWPFLLGALTNIAAVAVAACAQLEEIAISECERRKMNPRPDEIDSPNARLGFPPPVER